VTRLPAKLARANGAAVCLTDVEGRAAAVLECWFSGQAAGGAVADQLLRRAYPSGRLAETLPVRLEDNPAQLNLPGGHGHVRYGEGVFVGYRGYDALRGVVGLPVRPRAVLHLIRLRLRHRS
jgi:beta-glucosidase